MSISRAERDERRLALLLIAPVVLLMGAFAFAPVVATAWEALHLHDLRLPWLGRPYVGIGNFVEAFGDARFLSALLRTSAFALATVPIELLLGLALAMAMHTATTGRGPIRVAFLLPWAVPTVVAALAWRFVFEGGDFQWFSRPLAAWVPIATADIWKTTPFVAILLLAGLQSIDRELYDAARIDGAGALRRFFTITLPLLRPAIVVAGTFRLLDALRLFDLSYVMTGGGPGTATEPLSLYAFIALLQRLRFGYGSALSILVFALTFVIALLCVRLLGRSIPGAER